MKDLPRLVVLVAALFTPGMLVGQEPDSVIPLEGLVVTASPTPRPASAVASHVTVLDGRDLRERGDWTVAEALARVAGVSLARSGSYGATTSLFLRGGESDYTQVLLDGVPMNQPGGSHDFAGLTLEAVERIEIVRGPMSALYGSDAVSGVVNIITRAGGVDDGAWQGDVGLRVGTYGRTEASAGLRGGTARARYGVSLARHRTEGLLPFNNQHENTVFTGTVRLTPDPRTRADLTARIGDRVYHFPTDGSGLPVDRNALTFGDETTVGLRLSRDQGDHLQFRARLALHETDTGTDDGPDGPADTLGFHTFTSLDHVRRSSAEIGASLLFDGTVATLGAVVESQRQRSFTQSRSEYGPSSDRSSYRRSNRAVFTHLTHDGRGGAVQAGVRVEDNERYGGFVTWQVGGSLRVDARTRLRLTAGRGIKEPTFYEAFATGFARGNPTLEPERSRSLELGVDRSFASPGLTARVSVFRQDFRDLIQYTATPPSDGAPNFFNVAAARASGLEMSLEGRRGGWTGSASWAWLATEVRDGGFDEGPDDEFAPGERLLRRPDHALGLRAGWEADRVGAGVEVDVVGSRTDRDFSQFPARRVELPAYATVAVDARIRPWTGDGLLARAQFTLRVENLLDEDYQTVLGYGAPGRAVYLGMGVR